MFQIDLTSSGELLLYLPGGRTVEISATVEGIGFIKKIVLDYRVGLRNQPGYIGTLPTQHAVNKFLTEKKKRVAAELVAANGAKAKKLDIDWDKLSINL